LIYLHYGAVFQALIAITFKVKILATNSQLVYSNVYPNKKNQPVGSYSKWLVINCGPSWARTSDPLIMSVLFFEILFDPKNPDNLNYL
jgi:hypothetical protein